MNRINIYTQADEFFKTVLEPSFNELAESVLSEMKKSFKDFGDIDSIEAWKDRISAKLKDEADIFIEVMDDYFKDLKDYKEGEENLDEIPMPEEEKKEESEEENEEEIGALDLMGEEGGELAPKVPDDLELELGGTEEPEKETEEEKKPEEKNEEEEEEEEKKEGE